MDTKEELKDTKRKVQELEKKLYKEEREERIERQKSFRPIAKMAHDLLCGYNHGDGCSWGYEEDAGEGAWKSAERYNSHAIWLRKVEEICKQYKITPAEIEAILNLVKKMKEENKRAVQILFDLRR